jgi:hypothetical protein
MKKLIVLLFLLIINLACESNCEDCAVFDELTDAQAAIVLAVEDGAIVEVRTTEEGLLELAGVPGFDIVAPFEIMPVDFEFNSLLSVSEATFALDTCPAFPSLPSPEYDWFCAQTGEDGRFIGYDISSPTDEDIVIYEEYPSEDNPNPMTFKIYFSTNFYGAHQGTNSNYHAHRNWMKNHGWENARVDFCALNNPHGHPHCNQDEGTDGGI